MKIAAWLAVAFVCIFTMGPISFRPISPLPVGLERFGAYVIVGWLFAWAYPKHRLAVLICIAAGAGLLEVAQTAIPTRHGTLGAFIAKVAGAGVGVGAAEICRLLLSKI